MHSGVRGFLAVLSATDREGQEGVACEQAGRQERHARIPPRDRALVGRAVSRNHGSVPAGTPIEQESKTNTTSDEVNLDARRHTPMCGLMDATLHCLSYIASLFSDGATRGPRKDLIARARFRRGSPHVFRPLSDIPALWTTRDVWPQVSGAQVSGLCPPAHAAGHSGCVVVRTNVIQIMQRPLLLYP